MDWAANVDTAAFGALVSAATGFVVPRIIERVPEPEPESDAEAAAQSASGSATESHAGSGAGPEAGERADAAPRFEGASEAEEPPKETYVAIADLPGLAWKCALVGAVAGGLVALALGWQWGLLVWLPLVPLGLALGLIDWRTRLLPTWLVYRTLAVVVLTAVLASVFTQDWQDLVRAGVGFAGAGLLYYVLWFVYPRGLGFGDVRLSGVLGVALGYVGTAELVVGVYAGFLLGGIGGALLAMVRIVKRKHVPFGPFMLVGAVLGLLIGDWVGSLTNG
jgi:leader peptidase (prepilin peptidase)/N-methyltransferase